MGPTPSYISCLGPCSIITGGYDFSCVVVFMRGVYDLRYTHINDRWALNTWRSYFIQHCTSRYAYSNSRDKTACASEGRNNGSSPAHRGSVNIYTTITVGSYPETSVTCVSTSVCEDARTESCCDRYWVEKYKRLIVQGRLRLFQQGTYYIIIVKK